MKIQVSTLELTILKHTSEGYEAEDLARDLSMSKKEVESSLKGIYKKLQTKTPLESLQRLAKSEFTVVDN